ncbi:hypothetical protein, partial [Chryseosolibacter histidini]|uniref:hypothetical protein n=1 Tax=Chryseosolibacter histidini TaxID=2782349 RepID=UPI0020B33E13
FFPRTPPSAIASCLVGSERCRRDSHTAAVVTSDSWTRPYSRQKAAYPLPYIREAKFWPSVSRVDNAYGDRNLVCSCLPIEEYTGKPEPLSV